MDDNDVTFEEDDAPTLGFSLAELLAMVDEEGEET